MTTALDFSYIKDNLGIDPATTSKSDAHKILREHQINTTSWILTDLATVYGEAWAEAYRESIKNITCMHGFIGSCPYCKWGTE